MTIKTEKLLVRVFFLYSILAYSTREGGENYPTQKSFDEKSTSIYIKRKTKRDNQNNLLQYVVL